MFANLKAFEKVVIFILVIVIGFLIYILVTDPLTNEDAAPQEPTIGSLRQIQNDTRYKRAHKFSWVPALEKQSLFNEDTIFSGSQSEADVDLLDQTKIHLGPETMIKLQQVKKSPQLVFHFGSLTADVGSSTLLVQAGNETYHIQGKDLSLQIRQSRGEKTPQFVILKGSGEIHSSRGEVITPVPKSTPSPTPSPTAPPSPTPTVAPTPEPTATPSPPPTPRPVVKKKVTALPPTPPVATPVLSPTPILSPTPVPTPPAAPAPTPVAVLVPAPRLKEPFDEISYKIKRGAVSYIDFAWSSCAACASYELQISETADFSGEPLSFTSAKTTFNLQRRLSLKTYYWRVRGLPRQGTPSPTAWSPSRSFTVYNPTQK